MLSRAIAQPLPFHLPLTLDDGHCALKVLVAFPPAGAESEKVKPISLTAPKPFAFFTVEARSKIRLCGILLEESLEYFAPFKLGPRRTSGSLAIFGSNALFAPE